MAKYCDIILPWLLFATMLEPCSFRECSQGDSDGPEVHHFQCALYFSLLEDSLQANHVERHWLIRNFFPVDGSVASVMKMSVVITVGSIGDPLQTCSRNQQPTAFYFDGAQWLGKWTFRLSSSVILSFISENDLLSFDNTITWAIQAMATGIGGHGSEKHEVRFEMNKLFCNPSRDVMTEVLTFFLSKIKHIAKAKGTLENFDGKDKLYVSEKYYIDKDGKWHIVIETSTLGWKLLLVTFVLLIPLAMFIIIKKFKLFFFGSVVRDKLYTSIYIALAVMTFCINFINFGVFIIGLFYNHPDLDIYSSKFIFGVKMGITIIILAVIIGVTIYFFIRQIIIDNIAKERISILLHLIALVNLQLFVYSIIVSIIPIGLLLIVYPPQVLSSLAFIVSCLFCITIIISKIVFLESNTQQDKPTKVCLHVLLLLIFVVFICILIVFYLLLQSKGLNADSLPNFLLSLIPSGILTAFGTLLKRNLFKLRNQNPYTLC